MFYKADVRDIAGGDTTTGAFGGVDHPSGYQPDPGLVDAVNVALVLKRPLLLTGEPGTGKTQLAQSVAWQLARRKQLNVASEHIEKFETKSTSVSRDLFYSFDTLRRFHAAQSGGSSRNVDYLTYNALGRSVLNAMKQDDVRDFLPPDFGHNGPVRSVVLIDEIDKAPRDFPNDLLNEIDQMYFRVPELNNVRIGGVGKLDEDYRPITFITSNSEKNLPDPFLRRCIYYNIPFPDADRLESILLARLTRFDGARGPLVRDALQFFLAVRGGNEVRRKPSPAELIQWVGFMLASGASAARPLAAAKDVARSGLSSLTKDPEDQGKVRAMLDESMGKG